MLLNAYTVGYQPYSINIKLKYKMDRLLCWKYIAWCTMCIYTQKTRTQNVVNSFARWRNGIFNALSLSPVELSLFNKLPHPWHINGGGYEGRVGSRTFRSSVQGFINSPDTWPLLMSPLWYIFCVLLLFTRLFMLNAVTKKSKCIIFIKLARPSMIFPW